MGAFLMPSLGADMDSGTILEWRVAPGDRVRHGDIVAVVDTEKSDIEVEVFEDGVIEELLVAVGQEVAVGTPLARIGAGEGVAPPSPAAAPPAAPTVAPPPILAKATNGEHPKPAGEWLPHAPAGVRASPLARRRAARAGIDLASIRGSGPGGAIVAADLEAPMPVAPVAAPAVPPAARPASQRGDRQATLRRAVGDLMARSKREIPHYYVANTIDLAKAIAWLTDENTRRPVTERLLPAALLLKATARAAVAVPTLNGHWKDGFQKATDVHLGVAVSLRGGGLVAPAIRHADRLSLDELMAALRDLVERARAGRLRSSEMSDPTITVTNLGDQGAEEVFGVIYPPQVALVGFGRVVERPWAVEGLLGVRPTVRATLAADHRATDGHDGSRFLAAIARTLQAPEEL